MRSSPRRAGKRARSTLLPQLRDAPSVALWVALAAVVLLSGCGYTLGDPDRPAIERTDLERVSVTPFANRTLPYEPGVERVLHTALLQEIVPGPYVLASAAEADLRVTGALLSFRQQVRSEDTAGNPAEVSVVVRVQVTCTTRSGRRWTETVPTVSETFALSQNEVLADAADRAFRRAARLVIRRFVPPNHRWNTWASTDAEQADAPEPRR